MKDTANYLPSMHKLLKELIDAKSTRDKIKFTSYQLASALSMPRSIITKLTHPDELKRITNPRIETLIKIVEFFRSDGFDITIDDLLGRKNHAIEVQSELAGSTNKLRTVMLYSLSNFQEKIGTIDIRISNTTRNICALYAEDQVSDIFKTGSIFIIDLDAKPENDALIAIKLDTSEKIEIKKYYREKNKIILKALNDYKKLILMPTQKCEILGVVIQINAKT